MTIKLMLTAVPSVVTDHTWRPASADIFSAAFTRCVWIFADILLATKYPLRHFQWLLTPTNKKTNASEASVSGYSGDVSPHIFLDEHAKILAF